MCFFASTQALVGGCGHLGTHLFYVLCGGPLCPTLTPMAALQHECNSCLKWKKNADLQLGPNYVQLLTQRCLAATHTPAIAAAV